MHNILTDDASLNEDVPEAYRGLDRFKARKKIVAEFKSLGLLDKIEDYTVKIPRGDRSGAVVEPYLTDQWYVKIEPLAKPAIEAVETGKIKFVPENWSKTYFDWMYNIQDWCISRQLWWGHRIPAWYDDKGNVYVGYSEEDVRAKHGINGEISLSQDEDVLDTWFSSALWPFSTLGWPEKTDALDEFYPGDVLVTGFDIIFFWVARMIMMGIKFMGDVPFHEVYIHGLIREIERATRKQFPDGIEAFGCDALRFTFAALATTGRDIRFDLGRIEGYKNFCNKIWNAARYVLMNTEDMSDGDAQYSAADRWIRSRFDETTTAVHDNLATYRLDLAAKAMYEFTWHEFCDWYLELSKPVLQSDDVSDELKRGTQQTLIQVLESLLRLIHPFMPFISEEIWLQVGPRAGVKGETIMLQPFPTASDAGDADAVADIEWVKEFILGIRQIRGEMDISPGKTLPVLLQNSSAQDQKRASDHARLIQRVGRVESVTVLGDGEEPPASATALLGDMRMLVPMKGVIDVDAERARLDKQKQKAEADLAKTRAKLGNDKFVNNAPADVVTQERQRAVDFEKTIAQLDEQLEKLAELT
jgi:valyl-tRNA synthetase